MQLVKGTVKTAHCTKQTALLARANFSFLFAHALCSRLGRLAGTRSTYLNRDVGSISNLGVTTLRGHSFLKKKRAFSKNKKGTSLFIAKSWGRALTPVPSGSYVYESPNW